MNPTMDRGQLLRITRNLTVVCILGAALLGAVYVGTERYTRMASLSAEKNSIQQMLRLSPSARVLEVRQFYSVAGSQVIYQPTPLGDAGAQARRLTFSLDGMLLSDARGATLKPQGTPELAPLGRVFLAYEGERSAGFVVEGLTQGYKAKIRFMVALDSEFRIISVRVLEHEEDPGLGAETATPLFCGQYGGRTAADLARLGVTRDPMPEDWSQALKQLELRDPGAWSSAYGALRARENARPVYAVTGATISSGALTRGVQSTVAHFQRRWDLISRHLGGA